MKVLHSGTLDVNAGGLAMSTYLTVLGLNQLGVQAEIIMFPLASSSRFRGEKVTVRYSAAPLEHKFAFTPRYKRDVRGLGDYDIYHAQGVWQYPTYVLADVAKWAGKPYIITPRGMLYPQDIAKANTFFKKLSLKIRLLNDLNRAACVQVTCTDELRHCRDLGVTSPIAIIPNPVEIKEYPFKKTDEKFRLGYLGRISRKGGLRK